MTIAASWVRKIHNCEELVFISDSRLCDGHRWDECAKLTTLQGDTCVLAFAGDAEQNNQFGFCFEKGVCSIFKLKDLQNEKL